MSAKNFFRLLSDEEYVCWIGKHTSHYWLEGLEVVNGFRLKAQRIGIAPTTKIHAEVFPGAMFKRDIPQMGPCYKDCEYVQYWDFPDPPTEHAVVSWIPAPLSESTYKNVSEQKVVISKFSNGAVLPTWCQVSFGSAVHVAGMAFAHRQATGTDPFNGLVVRTDTCREDGRRIELGWNENNSHLFCGGWNLIEARHSILAVFAVGMVKAFGR